MGDVVVVKFGHTLANLVENMSYLGKRLEMLGACEKILLEELHDDISSPVKFEGLSHLHREVRTFHPLEDADLVLKVSRSLGVCKSITFIATSSRVGRCWAT